MLSTRYNNKNNLKRICVLVVLVKKSHCDIVRSISSQYLICLIVTIKKRRHLSRTKWTVSTDLKRFSAIHNFTGKLSQFLYSKLNKKSQVHFINLYRLLFFLLVCFCPAAVEYNSNQKAKWANTITSSSTCQSSCFAVEPARFYAGRPCSCTEICAWGVYAPLYSGIWKCHWYLCFGRFRS